MLSLPLEDYFSMGGHHPSFRSPHTANWRGYVGAWEIRNDRLYLIGRMRQRLPRAHGCVRGRREASNCTNLGLRVAAEIANKVGKGRRVGRGRMRLLAARIVARAKEATAAVVDLRDAVEGVPQAEAVARLVRQRGVARGHCQRVHPEPAVAGERGAVPRERGDACHAAASASAKSLRHTVSPRAPSLARTA